MVYAVNVHTNAHPWCIPLTSYKDVQRALPNPLLNPFINNSLPTLKKSTKSHIESHGKNPLQAPGPQMYRSFFLKRSSAVWPAASWRQPSSRLTTARRQSFRRSRSGTPHPPAPGGESCEPVERFEGLQSCLMLLGFTAQIWYGYVVSQPMVWYMVWIYAQIIVKICMAHLLR